MFESSSAIIFFFEESRMLLYVESNQKVIAASVLNSDGFSDYKEMILRTYCR